MSGKSVHLLTVVFALTLALTSATRADLVAWWRFDEGSGDTASDNSGNGHDGIIMGTPTWVEGAPDSQTALLFGTSGCDGVECGTWDPSADTDELTIACWIKWLDGPRWQWIVVKDENDGLNTVQYTLPAGSHTLEISYREVGVAMDTILIESVN